MSSQYATDSERFTISFDESGNLEIEVDASAYPYEGHPNWLLAYVNKDDQIRLAREILEFYGEKE